MPYRLKNARVLFISVVKDPATGRQFLYKSAGNGEATPAFDRALEFRKADDARQILYGVAYPAGAPDRVDAHGDFATADDVRAMAEDFMATGRVIAGIDRDHSYRPIEAFVAESWIVRKGDPLFGDPADEGAWAVGVKIANKALYDEFKNTGYRGFSIAGTAERVEIAKAIQAQPGSDEGLLARIRKLFAKEEDEMSQDVKDAIAELAKQVKAQGEQIAKMTAAGGEKPVEKKAGEDTGAPVKSEIEKTLEKALAPLVAKVEALEKAGKPDPVATAQKALDDAIEAGDVDAIKKAADALKAAKTGETGGEAQPQKTGVEKALDDLTAKVDQIAKAKPGSAQVDGDGKTAPAVKSIGIL